VYGPETRSLLKSSRRDNNRLMLMSRARCIESVNGVADELSERLSCRSCRSCFATACLLLSQHHHFLTSSGDSIRIIV